MMNLVATNLQVANRVSLAVGTDRPRTLGSGGFRSLASEGAAMVCAAAVGGIAAECRRPPFRRFHGVVLAGGVRLLH